MIEGAVTQRGEQHVAPSSGKGYECLIVALRNALEITSRYAAFLERML